MRKQTMDWKPMFSKHKIDRVLVPGLYEKLAKLRSIKERNNTCGWKFGQTSTLQDRWIERTWENGQHHHSLGKCQLALQ